MALPELTSFKHPLPRTAQRLSAKAPLVIVCLGSSSTAGAFASSPEFAYPARLAVEMQDRLPAQPLTVLNRGVNGEDAAEMVARMDEDVLSSSPDLIIWQFGTNWIAQGLPLAELDTLVRDSIKRLRDKQADIVLIDAQFAPPLLTLPDLPPFLQLMSNIEDEFGINFFRRCAIMRYWHEVLDMPFGAFLAEDDFHMNDWSYGCIAKLLAESITAAATAPAVGS
jgi:lysophospholipase L1-like esterase